MNDARVGNSDLVALFYFVTVRCLGKRAGKWSNGGEEEGRMIAAQAVWAG